MPSIGSNSAVKIHYTMGLVVEPISETARVSAVRRNLKVNQERRRRSNSKRAENGNSRLPQFIWLFIADQLDLLYAHYDRRYIYYTNTADRHALYRLLPEGGERSRVMDGGKAAGPVGIAGGKIYYQGLFQDSK